MGRVKGITPFIPPKSDPETKEAFTRVWAKLQQMDGDLDLNGYRIKNAGEPQEVGDYVTLGAMRNELGRVPKADTAKGGGSGGLVQVYKFNVPGFTINPTYTLGWLFTIPGLTLGDFCLAGHDQIQTLLPGCANSFYFSCWATGLSELCQVTLTNFNSTLAFNVPTGNFMVGLVKGTL